MVYAKYKRGDYTPFKREQLTPMTSLSVPPAKFISLKGFRGCGVKPSATLKLEIQRDNAEFIKYEMVNDTLVITDKSNTDNELKQGFRSNIMVNIYLPASVQLKGTYCDCRLWGAEDSVTAPSYNISLEKDSYLSINFRGPDNASVYFNQLNIKSDGVRIDLNHHAVINAFNLQLADSRLSDNSATIRKLTMEADNNSSIELSGKNIKALK